MFWNKKDEAKVAKVDGLPITLSLRTVWATKKLGFWEEDVLLKKFLAYKIGDTWNGIVGYEEYKKKTDLLEAKLDLILSHLKLKYIPETETKEPAKLVEKTVAHPFFDNLTNGAIIRCPDGFGGTFTAITPTLPKKKRGRPKKK